jgi:hypothetical protein
MPSTNRVYNERPMIPLSAVMLKSSINIMLREKQCVSVAFGIVLQSSRDFVEQLKNQGSESVTGRNVHR